MLDGTIGFQLREAPLPLVHGVARFAGMLYAGGGFGDVLDLIGPEPEGTVARAGWLMDRSWAYSLNFAPYQAGLLQQEALALHQVYRLRSAATGPRLLALVAAGDLMVNAPLDFIAEPAGLRLDLAFTRLGGDLPPILPPHDVAMVAASESAPEVLQTLSRSFGVWPRPILNDPERIQPMSRPWLPGRLAGLPGVTAAAARVVGRPELADTAAAALLPGSAFPYLLRPLGSHAGQGLARVDTPGDIRRFLADTEGDAFTLTQFIDYRGDSGWYCKYRIAFVSGQPFVCHMAASEHWMVHYLNAGMDRCADKRAAEAAAMLGSDGFLGRHATGLAAVAEAIDLDYVSIDCAETPAGDLLVFEADTAAIIHSLDPPELYPYKRPAMQRCYDAFGAMVRRKAGLAAG